MKFAVFFLLVAGANATTGQLVKMSTYSTTLCADTDIKFSEYFPIGCIAYHAAAVGSLQITASSVASYASKDCSGTALLTLPSSDTTTCTSSGTKMISWAAGIPAGSYVNDMWANQQSESGNVASISTACTGTVKFFQVKDNGICNAGASAGVYEKWVCTGTTCTKTTYSDNTCSTQTATADETVVNTASGNCLVAVAGTADTKPYPLVTKIYSPTSDIVNTGATSSASTRYTTSLFSLALLVTATVFFQ